MRGVRAVAVEVLGLVGPRTRRQMIALPLMARGVSAFEVIGAGAIFVLLGLLTNPEVASELHPASLHPPLRRMRT